MTPLWPRRPRIPKVLIAAIEPEEVILASCRTLDGVLVAASRFGCWTVEGDGDHDAAHRTDWHLISKATLRNGALAIVTAEEVGNWPDGTVLLVDRAAVAHRLPGPTRVTDVVHTRVRRSVAASRHLEWPGAGGWVVLRRVAGRDGLFRQVRLDAGADPDAPGFMEAADHVARALGAPVRDVGQ